MRSLQELEQVVSDSLECALREVRGQTLEEVGYSDADLTWLRSAASTMMSGPPSAATAEILATCPDWTASDLNRIVGSYSECGCEELAGSLSRMQWEMLDDGCLHLVRMPCDDGSVHYRIAQLDTLDNVQEGGSLGHLDGVASNPVTLPGWSVLDLTDRGRSFAHIIRHIWSSERPGIYLEHLFNLPPLRDCSLRPGTDMLYRQEEEEADKDFEMLWGAFISKDENRLQRKRDRIVGLLRGSPKLRELVSVLLDANRDLKGRPGTFELIKLFGEVPFSLKSQLVWDPKCRLETLHGICSGMQEMLESRQPIRVYDLRFYRVDRDGKVIRADCMDRFGTACRMVDSSPESLVRDMFRHYLGVAKPGETPARLHSRPSSLICHELGFAQFMRMLRWMADPSSYERTDTPFGPWYSIRHYSFPESFSARVIEPIDGVVVTYRRYWS